MKGHDTDHVHVCQQQQQQEQQEEHRNSSHLESLLSQLRPFQRAAFEFAVHGVSPDNSSAKRHNKSTRFCNSSQQDLMSSESVAGAGTGRILLGDEMGLGKTLTSLAIMLAYQQTEWPLLILCPASLRYTWPAEIEKFCPWIPPAAIHVVRGKDDVEFAVKILRWKEASREGDEAKEPSHRAKMNQGHFVIAANSVARSQAKPTTLHRSSKCPVQIVIVTYSLLQARFQVANVLKSCNFQCIIADESHNLKQLSSQRCQLALPILQKSKRLILLSGTPALNRPVELWPQIAALDPAGKLFGKYGMRYNEFTKRYCNAKVTRFGWDVKGVSNAEELHACLKKVMVRRLKAEVLHDLPPKQRSIVPVTVTNKEKEAECREIMVQLNAARQSLDDIIDDTDDEEANSARFEARRLLMQAYQISGIAKAPATTEYILDWLEGSDTQKLVVFAHHKEVLDYMETTISAKYKGRMGMIRIDGSVPPAERALRVKKFQSNAPVRLALLSMTAAGVGLTLTAANSIIFAELHFTPGVLAQAEDRCHRIGQANSVNVMYCICKDGDLSVDSSLWGMLGRKVGNLGRVVDGQRGKGMNAVDAEKIETGIRMTSKQHAVSAEEDLASFFANACSALPERKKRGPLVKGTLQSFFAKQIEKTKSEASANSDSNNSIAHITSQGEDATISLIEDSDEECHVEDTNRDANQKPTAINKDVRSLRFNCRACTYENLTGEICQMCGTPRIIDSLQSIGTANVYEWACKGCTLLNKNNDETCSACGLKRSFEQDRKMTEPIEAFDQPKHPYPSSVSKSPVSSIDLIDFDEDGSTFENENINDQSSLSMVDDQRDTAVEVLRFSVSKNTGRVALHRATDGLPLHVNFDISQVLAEDCAKRLEEAALLRNATAHETAVSHQMYDFDEKAVKKVLTLVDKSSGKGSLDLMSQELKSFVSRYMDLREIEKKALKDSGLAVTSVSLKLTAANLLISSVTGDTVERYKGGAKEKAIDNIRNNCATDCDQKIVEGKACAWCGDDILFASNSTINATYCSFRCAEEGRVRRGGLYCSKRIREQIFSLEHGVCCLCKLDAHALYCRILSLQPAERLNTLINAKFKLPKTAGALNKLLHYPKESDFWQADHIVAVAEGGGGCGLDNLRTLCNTCHSIETSRLYSRLKTSKRYTDDKQMDIVSAFSTGKSSRENPDNSKRKRRRTAD
ncbi:hypothetical protein HJC23_002522 [Cyclotella cryptica]|uniref:DNA annealing helicase and endonuclease ZRANB3 n=1 Tax=Cyclotella cryptica TaxID=29204 RepID=A0ABD3QVL4_9STRA